MIGRADIEGSKSDVAMNAWPPQASYPCGNFSDTSCRKLSEPKGSIGRAFAVPARTGRRDQASICPFAPREVSVLAELALGHLRYSLTDVPPQSNSPPGGVLGSDRAGACVGDWRRAEHGGAERLTARRSSNGPLGDDGPSSRQRRRTGPLRAPPAALRAWLENTVLTADALLTRAGHAFRLTE